MQKTGTAREAVLGVACTDLRMSRGMCQGGVESDTSSVPDPGWYSPGLCAARPAAWGPRSLWSVPHDQAGVHGAQQRRPQHGCGGRGWPRPSGPPSCSAMREGQALTDTHGHDRWAPQNPFLLRSLPIEPPATAGNPSLPSPQGLCHPGGFRVGLGIGGSGSWCSGWWEGTLTRPWRPPS